jgi:hypothetical protein
LFIFYKFVLGLERPTLSHLLQAAQLTLQQMVRAIPLKVALLNSFTDVYIKPRCGSDFASNSGLKLSLAEMKNEMLLELEEVLRNVRIRSSTSDSHTLSVRGICNNPQFEIAKQLAYSVVYVDEEWDGYKKLMSYILFNIYVAYQRCPKEITFILHEIIKRKYEDRNDYGNTCQEFGLKINNAAYEYLETISDSLESLEQNASNKRFYPEIYNLNKTSVCNSNSGLILLFNELRKCYHTYLKETSQESPFSFLDYSEAVLTESLTDDFGEYPLLKHCKTYLNIVDRYLECVVKAAEPCLDDETSCHLLQVLNWRNRFFQTCQSPMFVSKDGKTKSILKDDNVTLLYVHSKWLQKYTFVELFKLLPAQHDLIKKFNGEIKNIITNIDHDVSEMSRVSKKLRKLYGQPNLYKDEREYNVHVSIANDYKSGTLDFNQPLEKQLDKFSLPYTNETCALDLPGEDISFTVQLIETQKDISTSELIVKRLPINAYVLHRMMNFIKNTLLDITSSHTFGKEGNVILKNILHFAIRFQVFAPELLSLLQLVKDLYIVGNLTNER